METAEINRETFRGSCEERNCCSFRLVCKTTSSADGRAQGREELHRQQQGVTLQYEYQDTQYLQKRDQGQCQQHQLYPQPSGHSRSPVVLQFGGATRVLSRGLLDREERQRQTKAHVEQQRKFHQPLVRGPWLEVEGLEVCEHQYSQGSEDGHQQQDKHQRCQQPQQPHQQQMRVQYIHSQQRQADHVYEYATCEPPFPHIHAAGSAAVAAALDGERRGGIDNYVNHAQNISHREQELELRAPAPTSSLNDQASAMDIPVSRSASLARTTATENRTASAVTGAVLRKSSSAAQVANSGSVRGSVNTAISVCKSDMAASSAAPGHDCCSTSATATATGCATDMAAKRCDPDGLGGKGAARGAAPRRKQLSGAQKRKRKRELMSKCRVEQASLLSFLATTVTSELILNDWYALESQLRDESAYFERLSSSTWSLPTAVAAVSPVSAGAAGSRSTVAVADSPDADSPAASTAYCSGEGQHSELRNPLHSRRNTLTDASWSQFQKQQEELQWRQDQRRQQLYQDQRLSRRKERISREAQQHIVEADGQEGADQLLQAMRTTVMQDSGSCNCVDDNKLAATVTGTHQASQGIRSSSATSGFSNSSLDDCGNRDFPSSRCSTCSRSGHAPREVSDGTKSICASPAVYVQAGNTCRNTTGCCGDSLNSTAGNQMFLTSSGNTACSSNSNTAADRRASTGDSGVCTRNGCSTTYEDTSKPAEYTDAAALAVAPSRGVNGSQEIEDTASAAGRQAVRHMPSNSFERDEQHQALQTPRVGSDQCRSPKQKGNHNAATGDESTTHSNICYVTSTAGTMERSNTDSDHCSRIVSSCRNIKSSSRKTALEKESDKTPGAKTCNGSSGSRRNSSTRSSTSEGNTELRVCGRSALQELHDGFQAGFRTRAVAHTGESCSPMDSPLTATCRHRERTEAYTGFKQYGARDRCAGKELDRPSASEVVPSNSGDFLRTATHAGGDAAYVPLRDNNPSSTNNAGAAAKSSTDATTYGCSMLPRLEQQQCPQNHRAVLGTGAAARLTIGDKLLDEQEMKMPVEGDRAARGNPEEEERSAGAGQSVTKRSASTVAEAVETKRVSFTKHSYDDIRATTSCPTTSRRSSVSNATATIPGRRNSLSSNTTSVFSWHRSSTPTSSSTQRRWSPCRQLRSNDLDSAAGLLGAGKRNNSLAAADDEASTASSSPGPVLQQLPAPLLWLPPDCDDKTSRGPSPFSSVFDPEATGEARMPACIDSRRPAEDNQEHQLQQSQRKQFPAPHEQLTEQQHLQSHLKQPTLLQGILAQAHQPQKSVPHVKQHEEISQNVPVLGRHGEHEPLSSSESPVCTQAGRSARGLTAQQSRVSATEAEDSLSDPGLWPAQISVALRISLVKRGPVQIVDFDFPRDSTQRRFGRQHYWRTAATGERFWRSWLVYSKSRDAVYCFCCKLYSQLAKSVVSTGFRRWKGAAEVLRSHEQSKDHRMCMLQWKCMCMKVGAEVAFGDLMQLWLPCGSTSASAVSLGPAGNAAAAGSEAGLGVSSSASLAAGEVVAVAEDRNEPKAHAPPCTTETAPLEQEVHGHHVPEDQTKTGEAEET